MIIRYCAFSEDIGNAGTCEKGQSQTDLVEMKDLTSENAKSEHLVPPTRSGLRSSQTQPLETILKKCKAKNFVIPSKRLILLCRVAESRAPVGVGLIHASK